MGEEAALRVAHTLPKLPPLPAGFAPLSPPCSMGITQGALSVSGVGVPTYAAGDGGKVQDPGLYLEHNSGYSILRSCSAQYSPESFALFRFLGGKVSFTVDLSKVGCACNLAFYLTAQPAKGADGYFNPGKKGDYYCDANDVQSQWCPEIDIMEANNAVFAATPHTCDDPTTFGHFTDCDRSGRGENTRSIPGAYGFGSKNKINTQKPFTVTTEFHSMGETLTGMRTTLTQEGQSVTLEHGNSGAAYLARLSRSLASGMAIRITYWGKKPKTMAWLDEPPCGPKVACSGSNAGFAVISGITVQGSLAPPVYQPPRPIEVPVPTYPPALPIWAQQPTVDPFAATGDNWQPDFQEASPMAPTQVPLSPFAVAPPGQTPQFEEPVRQATRRTRRRPFHLRPKVALAALLVAITGAGLFFAIFPPCQRDPTAVPTTLQLQGRGPPQGYLGGPPPGFQGFGNAGPGPIYSAYSPSY